ncbi:MAG TPA: hypothetical protein DGG94_11040 [Micromonosporaceae bacterium]|nr:hypothetical protein [Micromonosporaceae bacterium]HCU50315.1 hypothetical protein [Micromonosporaceae bacterium]
MMSVLLSPLKSPGEKMAWLLHRQSKTVGLAPVGRVFSSCQMTPTVSNRHRRRAAWRLLSGIAVMHYRVYVTWVPKSAPP